jgi:hypothetical protein
VRNGDDTHVRYSSNQFLVPKTTEIDWRTTALAWRKALAQDGPNFANPILLAAPEAAPSEVDKIYSFLQNDQELEISDQNNQYILISEHPSIASEPMTINERTDTDTTSLVTYLTRKSETLMGKDVSVKSSRYLGRGELQEILFQLVMSFVTSECGAHIGNPQEPTEAMKNLNIRQLFIVVPDRGRASRTSVIYNLKTPQLLESPVPDNDRLRFVSLLHGVRKLLYIDDPRSQEDNQSVTGAETIEKFNLSEKLDRGSKFHAFKNIYRSITAILFKLDASKREHLLETEIPTTENTFDAMAYNSVKYPKETIHITTNGVDTRYLVYGNGTSSVVEGEVDGDMGDVSEIEYLNVSGDIKKILRTRSALAKFFTEDFNIEIIRKYIGWFEYGVFLGVIGPMFSPQMESLMEKRPGQKEDLTDQKEEYSVGDINNLRRDELYYSVTENGREVRKVKKATVRGQLQSNKKDEALNQFHDLLQHGYICSRFLCMDVNFNQVLCDQLVKDFNGGDVQPKTRQRENLLQPLYEENDVDDNELKKLKREMEKLTRIRITKQRNNDPSLVSARVEEKRAKLNYEAQKRASRYPDNNVKVYEKRRNDFVTAWKTRQKDINDPFAKGIYEFTLRMYIESQRAIILHDEDEEVIDKIQNSIKDDNVLKEFLIRELRKHLKEAREAAEAREAREAEGAREAEEAD